MAKQPEQILEEQLVAQLQRLGYGLVGYFLYNKLKVNNIKILVLKMFTEIKKGITFVPTVLAAPRSERAAYQGESFAFIGFPQDNNKPPLPLLQVQNAHLGGLFF